MEAVRAARACGYVLGAELRACGVDFSFTPVLDLDHGASGVIGDRAFARDPRVASLLAQSLVHGLLQSGMASCGKHFPGHGFVKADSHLAVPVDKRGLKTILADDAAPYHWLGATLASVMPAHVIYPKVDSRPAGFSKVWLQDILRGRLGRALSYTDAALAALNAGCDMVLLCNQSLAQADGSAPIEELLAGLTQAISQGVCHLDARSEARRQALLPRFEAPDWDQLLSSSIYQRSLAMLP
jgi:beta-N-acetylhexosaminidase